MNTWTRNIRHSWNPWDEMRLLNQDLQRLLSGTAGHPAAGREFPAVNIWANEEAALLTAELPGVDPATLDVAVQNDTVTVKGTRAAPEQRDGEQWLRQERAYGDFARSFALPFRVDPEKVVARAENGVLTITLPRTEEEKPRRIVIRDR